jgi:hypothetical protein
VRRIEFDVSSSNITFGLICAALPLFNGRLDKSVSAACEIKAPNNIGNTKHNRTITEKMVDVVLF